MLAGRVSSSEEAWLQSLLSVQGKERNIALATVLIFVLLFHCLKEIRYDPCSSHCKPVFKLVQEKMCGMGSGLFLLCVCVCTCLWNIWFLLIIACIKLNLSASVHTLQAWGYWSLATEKKSFKVLQKPSSEVPFFSKGIPEQFLKAMLPSQLMRMDGAEERAAAWRLGEKEEQRSSLPHGIEITSTPGAARENKWKNNRSLHVAMELFCLDFRHAVKYDPSLCPCYRQP